jgi:hypothetical protein
VSGCSRSSGGTHPAAAIDPMRYPGVLAPPLHVASTRVAFITNLI